MTTVCRCSRSAPGRYARNIIFALATISLLAMPSRNANAEIFTAIAIVASAISTLISLGDTGADPRGEMTAQNREMLMHMHKRLDGHDRAFKAILKKLDALPDEIKKEIDDSTTKERIARVRTAIDLISTDWKILKELRSEQVNRNGEELTPIASASLRLDELQKAIGDLLQSEDDIKIAFDIIAARYIEHAMIAMQADPAKQVDWDFRKEKYRNRFSRMLQSKDSKSLEQKYDEVRDKAKEYLNELKEKVGAATKQKRDPIGEVYNMKVAVTENCRVAITFEITDAAKEAYNYAKRPEGRHGPKGKDIAESYDKLRSIYRYMKNVVKYELDALDSMTPTRQYPEFKLSEEYWKKYSKQSSRIRRAVRSIPEDRVFYGQQDQVGSSAGGCWIDWTDGPVQLQLYER